MAQSATCYANETPEFFYTVTYRVDKTGTELTYSSDSPYLARQFVNKLKRSKTCTLLSYPNFYR